MPEAIDAEVARLKLAALGITLDPMTPEQIEYVSVLEARDLSAEVAAVRVVDAVAGAGIGPMTVTGGVRLDDRAMTADTAGARPTTPIDDTSTRSATARGSRRSRSRC